MSTSDHTPKLLFKRCSFGEKCIHPNGPWLPATDEYFTKRSDRPCGLSSYCRKCHTASSKKRRQVPEILAADKLRKKSPENIRKRGLRRERRREADRNRYHTPKGKALAIIYFHRRRAKKLALPHTFTLSEWRQAVAYWDGRCAYCGNPPSLFDKTYVLHQDHWIPLNNPDCPGTVSSNMLPVCQTCNLSKKACDPVVWLQGRFGKRIARTIEDKVLKYFEWTRSHEPN